MILFRTDANSTVGMGHLMRCLSIAEAFLAMGETCCFMMSDGGFTEIISSKGHQLIVLQTCFNQMNAEKEAEIFSSVIRNSRINALIVDSYFVTEPYLDKIQALCGGNRTKLVYIDDILAFPYSCDMLINYNIYAMKAAYLALYQNRKIPYLLLGPLYTPLRKEFQNRDSRLPKEHASEILISTGGADPVHIGLEMVKEIIDHKDWRNYRFHLIIGALNPDRKQIRFLTEEACNVILHENVNDMANLMQYCDVAISAAGSTLYELCATKTPTITYVLADNQMPGAAEFEKRGIVLYSGDVRELGAEKLAKRTLFQAVELARDFEKRRLMTQMMKTIVDGTGADRICKEILSYSDDTHPDIR